MKAPIYSLSLAVLFFAGCSKQSTPANNSPGNSAINAASDYAGAMASGKNAAIKTVDIASLNQAIQMFNVNEGRFPKDLDELVKSQLIVKIPDAPAGMKLNYDPATGAITVVKAE